MEIVEARKICELLFHLADCSVSPYQKAEIWCAFNYYSPKANLDKDFFVKMRLACGFERKTLVSVLKTRQEKGRGF